MWRAAIATIRRSAPDRYPGQASRDSDEPIRRLRKLRRGAEEEGPENFPLYKWTKAIVEDPAKRAKHIKTFAMHVSGKEVYPKAAADALEADLQPLLGGKLVTRMSRHDTNPANNLQVPSQYRL